MGDITLGRLMGAINKNVEALFNNRLSESDFNLSYLQYLLVISVNNGMNQNELARKINVGKASASKAVKYLVLHHLVYCLQDETDNRIKNVFVTKEGKKIADQFKVVFLEINSKLSEGFSEYEISVLKNMLERICENSSSEKNNFIISDLGYLEEK